MTSRKIARAALLLLIISAALPTAVDSCFDTTSNVAFFRTRPDATFKEFLSGNLGVIQSRWDDRYLYATYRQLSGQPFSDGERRALIHYFLERDMADAVFNEDPEGEDARKREAAWKRREKALPLNRWIVAREQVPGAKNNQLKAQERDVFFAQYVNCTDDAFTTAIETLKDRQERFGKDSKYVLEWLEGQDAVFLNCQKGTSTIPENVGQDAPLLLKQDRAYQRAAAYFYSQEWEQARAELSAIAADTNSPWSPWAAYLAARCLVRKSTLSSGDEEHFVETTMEAAEQELKSVLAHTKDPRVHRAAEQIMDFVRFRLHPDEYQADLNRRLAKPSDPSQLVRRLKDYLFLIGPKTNLNYFSNEEGTPPDKPALRPGEIAEWMWAVSLSHPWSGSRTLAAYRAKRTLPWLVAALMNAKGPEKEGLDEILSEAERVPVDSPAFLTVNLHRARLLRARGAKKDARAIIRPVLGRNDLSPSTRTLFRAQLVADAETLDEFLENSGSGLAGTTMTGESESQDGRNTIRPLVESAWIFNHELPIEKLVIAANSDRLAKEVRHELAPAVWTRAILLEKLETADAVAAQVVKVAPEMEKLMAPYMAATTRDEKFRAAWFAIVKAPGLSPYVNGVDPRGVLGTKDLLEMDHYRDNWWCEVKEESEPRFTPPVLSHGAVQGRPDFVSPDDSATAAAEWEKLSKTDVAPIYLSKNIVAWAKKTPDDPRIPEALHRTVRASRYTCYFDPKITKYSRAAFQLLHQKYPKSEWAKKTKYYF
jgi:hypothetical protein